MKTLTRNEIEVKLAELTGWSYDGERVSRIWRFADFLEAMRFVQQIASMAEEAQHHPDIDIRYNVVQLSLVSHDEGGITPRDISMAKRINGAYPA